MHTPHIVICGNGASAAILALSLARIVTAPLAVTIIGTGAQPGEGHAYATRNPSHLMNVPAARLSVNPDAPEQFRAWLQDRGIDTGTWAGQFVPRLHFARYLHDQCVRELARNTFLACTFLRAEITGLSKSNTGWRIVHGDGTDFISADAVVLATGNDMPTPVAERFGPDAAPFVTDNPWGDLKVARDDDVLIVGTGLTAIDALLTLQDQGHAGKISLLSRHGLFPMVHHLPEKSDARLPHYPETARSLLRTLRDVVGRNLPPAVWQGRMDALRPVWRDIWRALPPHERRRALRHGVTFWNLHRHRVAPQISQRLADALAHNARLVRGRLKTVTKSGDGTLAATCIHGRTETVLKVNRIVNCMGPNSDPEKTRNRLLENIIASRLARPGPAGIGIDTDDRNRVCDHDGSGQPTLLAIGALTRGRLWEITAIPEIVRQAKDIAHDLARETGRG